MAKILGVKDRYSLKCAIDLGIAMQLTNIARDVVEDKKRSRTYIDHDFNSIKKTISIAETFYDRSFLAIKSIPIISDVGVMMSSTIKLCVVTISAKKLRKLQQCRKDLCYKLW